MEDPPAGNSEGGSNVPSREEFNTGIDELNAKLESLMMTIFQVVHGTAPAATGDGGESRGGRHTAPGAEQQGFDQAPNTGGTLDSQRHREESASSVGDVSRESAQGELLAHHTNPIYISSRVFCLWRQAISSYNAPSRFARDVGGRDTSSRNVPRRRSLLGPW